jgi:hypothetical protein
MFDKLALRIADMVDDILYSYGNLDLADRIESIEMIGLRCSDPVIVGFNDGQSPIMFVRRVPG